jgi:hypothetical protein
MGSSPYSYLSANSKYFDSKAGITEKLLIFKNHKEEKGKFFKEGSIERFCAVCFCIY